MNALEEQMNKKSKKIIIEGVDADSGEIFRPSNWAERMSESMSTFNKRRIHYSPLLQPTTQNGHQCVVLDPKLKASNPVLYQSILDFAKNNHLKICNDNSNESDS